MFDGFCLLFFQLCCILLPCASVCSLCFEQCFGQQDRWLHGQRVVALPLALNILVRKRGMHSRCLWHVPGALTSVCRRVRCTSLNSFALRGLGDRMGAGRIAVAWACWGMAAAGASSSGHHPCEFDCGHSLDWRVNTNIRCPFAIVMCNDCCRSLRNLRLRYRCRAVPLPKRPRCSRNYSQ